MKLGKQELAILEFLDYPASEELLLTQFAPVRLNRNTRDAPKVRLILSRLISKGLIQKKGNTYEKILHQTPANS